MDINKQNFYFVSTGCAADYLNNYYGIYHCSPFAFTSVDVFQFLYFIDHYDDVDLTHYKIIPNYKDTRAIQYGNINTVTNKRLGVDTEKTFGAEFNYKSSSQTIQFYYRHYELNNKNIEKMNMRLQRQCSRKPFFVIQLTPPLLNALTEEEKEKVIQLFNSLKCNNKLFICSSKEFMPNSVNSIPEKYCLFTPLAHEPLMPVAKKHLDAL